MDVDLNINNYNLDDLLNLFQIPNPFEYSHLKQAYKIVLKTHPDKSGLDKEYFLFFSKSFKMLKKIYDYTHKNTGCVITNSQNYNPELNEYIDVSTMTNEDKEKFRIKFNALFEKVKIEDDEQDGGYSEWLRGSEGTIDVSKVHNTRDLHSTINDAKQQQRSLYLAKYNGVNEEQTFKQYSLGSSLIREKPEYYSAALFSKFQYEDVKKAHSETLVPVTEEDFYSRKQFKTTDELERYRRETSALGTQEHMKTYAQHKQQKEEEENLKNAYKMMKQMEEIERKNKIWNSHFKQLTN
jgi:curved DNA-binding protein CbpA